MKKGSAPIMAVKAVIAVSVAFIALGIATSTFISLFDEGVSQQSTEDFITNNIAESVAQMCTQSGTQGPFPASGNKFKENFPNADEVAIVTRPGEGVEETYHFVTYKDGSQRVMVYIGYKDSGDSDSCDSVELESISGGAADSGMKEFEVEEQSEDEVKVKVWDG